jgi:four helix bundle protein
MQPDEKDLRQRTKEFGLQIVRMFSELPKITEAQVLGKQVLRSGTSIGANYREAIAPAVERNLSRNAVIRYVSSRNGACRAAAT